MGELRPPALSLSHFGCGSQTLHPEEKMKFGDPFVEHQVEADFPGMLHQPGALPSMGDEGESSL